MFKIKYNAIKPYVASFSNSYKIIEIEPKISNCGNYRFFGVMKKKHHFINPFNEIFIKDENNFNYYKYVFQWCEINKKPYTYYNEKIYKTLYLKNKKYFYDMNHFDTYKFDETKQIVKYVGRYNGKINKISVC